MAKGVKAETLLKILSMGEPVSGAELSKKLGVSRTAIWKHIVGLRAMGLPILAQAGLGYCLEWPVELLDREQIYKGINNKNIAKPKIFWQLDSTQLEMARQEHGLPDSAVILAENQTAGLGRRGRNWYSPIGANIYLSYLKRFKSGLVALSGLPLVVGFSLIKSLEEIGVSTAKWKWPNDIIIAGAKLAGVLIELHGEYGGPYIARVGIGVNVRLVAENLDQISQRATDLSSVLGADLPSRNDFVAILINNLNHCLNSFEKNGIDEFITSINKYDALYEQKLVLSKAPINKGIGAGIDKDGALLVKAGQEIHRIISSDVSVDVLST